MQVDLSGQVILVTGASRGIGRAIACHLASAGATVAAHYHRNQAAAEVLATDLGHDACSFQADLESVKACKGLFEAVLARYGHLDVLINNAGVARLINTGASVHEWSILWANTMNVNVRATALLCRLAVRHFESHGGGRIINLASRAAFRGSSVGYMAYAMSKGAVVALTRSIARAYGKQGVAAFIIAPGFVRTDMGQGTIDAYGEEFIMTDIALSQLTEPVDVAPIITLLASGLADHATGATIDINAGGYVH